MSRRKYVKKQDRERNNFFQFGSKVLPLHLLIAVYYRQSQEAQVGNHSTGIQKTDWYPIK